VSISVSNKQLFLPYFYGAAYFKLNIVLRQRVLFHCRNNQQSLRVSNGADQVSAVAVIQGDFAFC